MRAVAYIRVSSASQVDGYSLDAQDRLFHEFCKSRGWEPVNVYREEGRSAHHEAIARRPIFNRDSPYGQSSDSKGSPNEIVASYSGPARPVNLRSIQ